MFLQSQSGIAFYGAFCLSLALSRAWQSTLEQVTLV
jgi:hypothetical protein